MPELAPSFQSKPKEATSSQPPKRNLNAGQYGSAPSISEEAVRAKHNVSLSSETKPPSREFSQSLKGLASPLVAKLATLSSPIPSDANVTKSLSHSQNFELYVNSKPEKTKVLVNCPPEVSPPATTQETPKGSVQTGKGFVPNIYNKIEISYITNNYQASAISSAQREASDKGIHSLAVPGQETTASLNESYNIDAQRYRDSKRSPADFNAQVKTEAKDKANNLTESGISRSYIVQISGTEIKSQKVEDGQTPERPSTVAESHHKVYNFKDDVQYRSLHELSPYCKDTALSNRGTPGSFLNDLSKLHLAIDNVKSQTLPKVDPNTKDKIPRESESQSASKRSFLSKLDRLTQKLPINLGRSAKALVQKSVASPEAKDTTSKLVGADSKSKISKRINNIFKNIGMSVAKEPGIGISKVSKEKNNLSQNSVGIEAKPSESSISSVHEIVRKLGGKKSLRSSLLASGNPHDAALNNLRTSRGQHSSSSRTRLASSGMLGKVKTESKDVTIYKASNGTIYEERTQKDDNSYNLLYHKGKASALQSEVGRLISAHDRVFPSVYDPSRKVYVRQALVNLHLLSKMSPTAILSQLVALAQQLWSEKSLSLSTEEGYGLTVRVSKNTFLLRVEALEEIEGLYTIVLYPKSIQARLSYLRDTSELLKRVEV